MSAKELLVEKMYGQPVLYVLASKNILQCRIPSNNR